MDSEPKRKRRKKTVSTEGKRRKGEKKKKEEQKKKEERERIETALFELVDKSKDQHSDARKLSRLLDEGKRVGFDQNQSINSFNLKRGADEWVWIFPLSKIFAERKERRERKRFSGVDFFL